MTDYKLYPNLPSAPPENGFKIRSANLPRFSIVVPFNEMMK